MSQSPVTVPPDVSLRTAATRMRANEIGSLLVLDDEELVGIVTERDVTRMLADDHNPDAVWVAEAMSGPVIEIEPNRNVEDAIEVMVEHGVRRLAVVLDNELRGVVSVTDIAYAEPELARQAHENLRTRWRD